MSKLGDPTGRRQAEVTGRIDFRLPKSLHLRLRARAIALGIPQAELIRRAVTAYIEGHEAPTRFAQITRVRNRGRVKMIHLPILLQHRYQIPRSVARQYITQGRVKVNGQIVTDLDIDPPQGGVELELK